MAGCVRQCVLGSIDFNLPIEFLMLKSLGMLSSFLIVATRLAFCWSGVGARVCNGGWAVVDGTAGGEWLGALAVARNVSIGA